MVDSFGTYCTVAESVGQLVTENGDTIINQRSCGIAHEFGHVITYLNGQPHSHSNNADYIYGRQWTVMKRYGYEYL